ERNFAARMRAIEAGSANNELVRPRMAQPIEHEIEEHEEADETALAPEAEIDQVTFRPTAPRPSLFPPLHEEQRAEETHEEPVKPFIPPLAEKPIRTPRMPRIEELPVPGQNELRASRGESVDNPSIDTKRMTLLQRLANMGVNAKAAEEKPGISV